MFKEKLSTVLIIWKWCCFILVILLNKLVNWKQALIGSKFHKWRQYSAFYLLLKFCFIYWSLNIFASASSNNKISLCFQQSLSSWRRGQHQIFYSNSLTTNLIEKISYCFVLLYQQQLLTTDFLKLNVVIYKRCWEVMNINITQLTWISRKMSKKSSSRSVPWDPS